MTRTDWTRARDARGGKTGKDEMLSRRREGDQSRGQVVSGKSAG